MPVQVRYGDCASTLHSAQDDRALLSYLTTSGYLKGRRNDCARTTSGMVVTVDSGELSVPFTKTGEEQIWAHVVVTDAQQVTFQAGNGSNRYDALVCEIINDGTCSADADEAAAGEGSGRFTAVQGSAASAISDGDITTALGHANWLRINDVYVPAAATAFGGGGSDASLANDVAAVQLASNPTSGIEAKFTAIHNNDPVYATATGSSNNFVLSLTTNATAWKKGQRFYFESNQDISGSATLNPNSWGQKTIKRMTSSGLIDLVSGDIRSGSMCEVVYNGTYCVLVSVLATDPTKDDDTLKAATADSTAVGASSTAEANMDVSQSVSFAVGRVFRLRAAGLYTLNSGTNTLRIKLGTVALDTIAFSTTGSNKSWIVDVQFVVRTVNASGSIYGMDIVSLADNIISNRGLSKLTATVDTTTSQTLQLSAQFSASDAGHTCKIEQFYLEQLTV